MHVEITCQNRTSESHVHMGIACLNRVSKSRVKIARQNRIGIADICQNCKTGHVESQQKIAVSAISNRKRPFSAIWADLGIAAAM